MVNVTTDDRINKTVKQIICECQGRIFECAARRYSPEGFERFANLYMRSGFCARAMDSSYSRFQFADEDECMEHILPEVDPNGALPIARDATFDPGIAAWMGYTYRRLAFTTGLGSAELVGRVTVADMIRNAALHTVDEDYAEEALIRNFGLPIVDKNDRGDDRTP